MGINMTLVGQMITFVIFIWFTMKYVWPPLMKLLEERRKKIADGLEAAERGVKELELAQRKAKEIVREAKSQASIIIEQANMRAHNIEEEAHVSAREITDKMKRSAENEIAQKLVEVKTELRNQVAGLAVAGAEKLIRRNIDKAANNDILEQLAEGIK
jgi:F-type H+-transporting ATPase subunit b